MPDPSPICAVLFDMDGVLTDSEPLINAAAVAMFQEQGLAVQPQDFLPFVGAGEDRYIGGVAEKHKFPLDLSAAKRRTYELYLERVPLQLEAFPGAQELVWKCRQAGLRVVVASSADRIKIAANLLKIGLPIETWSAAVTGEDVKARKPAPDIFLTAARKLGVAPNQCVVVEDAVNGVQAAKAAGMRCVAVAQTFPADQLQAADLVRLKIAELSVQDLVGSMPPPPPSNSHFGEFAEFGVHPLGCPPRANMLKRGHQTPVACQNENGCPPPLPPIIVEGSGPNAEPPVTPPPSGPWGFWATLGFGALVGIAWAAVQFVVVLAWALISMARGSGSMPKDLGSNGLLLALASCASAPVAFGLTWLFARLRQGMSPREYLGFCPVPGKTLVRWTMALLLFAGLSDFLTDRLGRPIVPDFMQQAYQTAGFTPLLWLTLLVAAPLMEETLFRGFLFRGILQSRLGATGAITITALLWSLIHVQYDAYGIATIFALGLLLGYARLKTGSLHVTMFLHSISNLIATAEAAWVLRSVL
jgi:HAD superfamily hydrolase (TIGR01509 family)